MATSTTISSYICTNISPHLTSKSIPSLICISAPRVPRTHSYLTQQLCHTHITPKSRIFSRISAAVSQKEAPAAALEEELEVVEEGKAEESEGGGGEEEAVSESELEAVQEKEVEEEKAEESEGEGGEEEAVSAPEPEQQNTKLYFGNLPYNCDSSQLAGIVQEYASPEMVEVLYDRVTGRSRGFAFVTMSSVEDCEHVIKNLDGSQFNGRIMRVNFSDKPKSREPLYKETEYKLFVGNLSWSATSESLEKAFQQCGNVVSARVLYDGDTGKSRGYGFVCYSTKEEMEAALETLDGAELDGRPMRVSLAEGRRY